LAETKSILVGIGFVIEEANGIGFVLLGSDFNFINLSCMFHLTR